MRNNRKKKIRTILAFALTLAIGVAFMPISGGEVYAATFSTSAKVKGFAVSAYDSHSVSFKWDAYAGATGYHVFKASSENGSYTKVGRVLTNSWKRTNLTTNKTCYYKVRAFYKDKNGKVTYSQYSDVIAGTPYGFETGKAVSGFAVTASTGNSVSFAWGEYTLATGYHVFKSSSKDGKYEKVGRVLTNSWTRTGLTTNKTCYYKVRAFYKDSKGKVTYSQFSSPIAGTPQGFDAKGKPADFKGMGTTYNSISIAWSPYNMATGYEVYKSTSKNGKYEKIKSTTDTSYTRTGLTTNKKCYYKVRAYRTENGKTTYSAFTSPVSGTPKMVTPAVSVAGQTSSIKISWNAVSGASGYEVYRATSKNGSYSKIGTTSSKSYTNDSITKNKYYYYKVRAYRTVSGSKKYSGYSSVKEGVTGPGQVGQLTAVSEEKDIKLSWGKVSGASGYEIQRAGNDGKYSVVGTSTTNSFKDVNVANGQTYYYKVRAYTSLSGGKSYGAFNKSGYSRSTVVSTAVAWLGCKESNKSNKPIIDLYNKNMGTNFSYTTAWCAMFVSAVAIKSGTTSIIVRGSYCPTVINTYKNSKTSNYKYAAGSKYVPKAGDVIFFDWNKNGVPDHTGLVASVSGNTIKTIEGNYSDAVGYRTFSVGYSMVLGYGLPNYDNANGIVYTGTSNQSVGCGELNALGIGTEPEGYEDLGAEYNFVEQKVEDNIGCDEKISDLEKMTYMVKKVRTNAETDGIDCSKSQYYAAFIYKLCKEADIEASIMTAEDADGNIHAWVETVLDGKWYKVDASKKNNQIERFEHEATDIEG
ncbi:MAG: CHAP domain-containing protein [Bacillota bacterium]|nr:CHAP domain-containing protein [Bacillota bacterium]